MRFIEHNTETTIFPSLTNSVPSLPLQETYGTISQTGRFLLSVVRSYVPGCEPLVTGNLAMGLTIRSSHKQELSSVYQFIDVLYSLCIYEALRH